MRKIGRQGNYLEGATYAGWRIAGATLGLQEAARMAAAAAIKANFMGSMSWFWVGCLHEMPSNKPLD